jgi:hypothetical protein
MNKITQKKYLEFRMWFFTTDKHIHLRLGQAFLNEFFPTIPDDELFYTVNPEDAQTLIYERYIDID